MSPATCSTTASACWAASPPCLMRPAVPSPAAYTRSRPSTRPCRSVSMNPRASHGTPGIRRPAATGRETIRSAVIQRPLAARSAVSLSSCAVVPAMTSTPRAREDVAHAGAHPAAEDLQRVALGGDQGDLHLRGPRHRAPRGRHQRHLVGRERPTGLGRHDDRDAAGQPGREVDEGFVEGGGLELAVEDDAVLVGGHGAGADRDHEHVVGEPLPGVQDRHAILRFDAGQGGGTQAGVLFVGELGQRIAAGSAEAEGLAHLERAVREVGLRGDERDLQPAARPGPQADERLERGDPAAGDDHAQRVTAAGLLR